MYNFFMASSWPQSFLVMEDTKFFHGHRGCKASLAMEDITIQDSWVLGWNNKLLDLSH
jgi:hypothetical protein